MPTAEFTSIPIASSASSGGGPKTRSVIPLSSTSGSGTWRAAIYRIAAYVLAFVAGAAAMFALRGALHPYVATFPEAAEVPIESSRDRSVAWNGEPLATAPLAEFKPRVDAPAFEKPEVAVNEDTGVLRLTGTLEPAPGRYARLSLATSQAVAFVDVRPGDRVRKGWQVFSHWESPERLQAAKLEVAKTKKFLDVAQSHASAADKTAARARKLAGQISAQELQDAETAASIRRQELAASQLAVQEAESRFAALEFEFNQAFVTTPIDGVVAAVDVVLGERRQLTGGSRGVTVLDPSVLHCRCLLDDGQLAIVRRFTGLKDSAAQKNVDAGDSGESSEPAWSGVRAVVYCQGKEFAATVASVGIAADAATGRCPLLVEVQNPSELLTSGAKVEVALSPAGPSPAAVEGQP